MIVTVKRYGWVWEAVARRGSHWASAYSRSRQRAINEAVLRLDSKYRAR